METASFFLNALQILFLQFTCTSIPTRKYIPAGIGK